MVDWWIDGLSDEGGRGKVSELRFFCGSIFVGQERKREAAYT